jgi:hypothetical protein
MKIYVILFLTIFILCKCNTKNANSVGNEKNSSRNHKLIPTYDSLFSDERLDSIILAFIKSTPCDSCIYEMHVDKVLPSKSLVALIIRPIHRKYFEIKNPLFTIDYGNKTFFVYTGLEEILKGDKKFISYPSQNSSNNIFNQWDLTIDSSQYEVETNKANVGMPFFPQTPFIPPSNKK